MPSDRVERKLAAILAADVAGYSRLMGAEEERTLTALRAHRTELIDPAIAAHRGRIANTAGDSLLVEFASVVDAVRCAVAIQQGMATRNQPVPEAQRLVFRMGINVGDVMVQGTDLLGDGVNIAARLEQISQPGSVYISRSVHEQTLGRVPFEFDGLGPQQVKNIAHPVEVWRVRWEGEVALSPAPPAPAPATDTRPSIAVLPFQNMSGDPEQEYFIDGLTEDLITDLAAVPGLRIIARNTMFSYKGKPANVPQVGRELGVTHVVEGSVRASNALLRVTAQLIQVSDGAHVWAGRYDKAATDPFAVQDELVRAIITEVLVHLEEGDHARTWRSATTNLRAMELFQLGRSIARRAGTRRDHAAAQRYFEEAIALDPNFTSALIHLGIIARMRVQFAYTENPDADLRIATDTAQKAIALRPSDYSSYCQLGFVSILRGRFDEGERLLRRGVEVEPNAAGASGHLAEGLMFLGLHAEALATMRQAMHLTPRPAPWMLFMRGMILFHLERFAEAIKWLEPADPRINSRSIFVADCFRAATYAALENSELASAAIRLLMEKEPSFQLEAWLRLQPYRQPEDVEHLRRWLHRAGVPE